MGNVLDWIILFSCIAPLYGLFVFVSARMDIKKIRAEFLIESVIAEIKKANSEEIAKVEKNLKVSSIVYIDSNLNRINKNLTKRIKQVIEKKL